jgi:hypothetical protein
MKLEVRKVYTCSTCSRWRLCGLLASRCYDSPPSSLHISFSFCPFIRSFPFDSFSCRRERLGKKKSAAYWKLTKRNRFTILKNFTVLNTVRLTSIKKPKRHIWQDALVSVSPLLFCLWSFLSKALNVKEQRVCLQGAQSACPSLTAVNRAYVS